MVESVTRLGASAMLLALSAACSDGSYQKAPIDTGALEDGATTTSVTEASDSSSSTEDDDTVPGGTGTGGSGTGGAGTGSTATGGTATGAGSTSTTDSWTCRDASAVPLSLEPRENTCPVDLAPSGDTWQIVCSSDTQFQFGLGAADPYPMDCQSSGWDFDCSLVTGGSETTWAGTITADGRMEGEVVVEVLVSPGPCRFRYGWVVELR